MKRMMMLVGLTGAMAVAGAMPAMAINKEWSAALGFLGGVLVERGVEYRHGGYGGGYYGGGCARPVVVEQTYCPQPVYVQSCPPPVIVQQPQGHYEFRQEQRWIAESSHFEQIDVNTYRKVCIPGHYETFNVKVFVQDPWN